jgi:hypothetical protein
MIARFRAGEFTTGVIDGLDTLTIASIADYPDYTPVPVATDEGTGLPTAAILVLVLLLAGVAAVTVGRQWIGGGWAGGGDTGSSPSWWSTPSRNRAHRSFGSFGSGFGGTGRSSSSSPHSSGGGSRRSGGGSKRW